ncbi:MULTISPECIES: hypothetical protein [unclassified Vibrio]|uniref:hypothetical protein n=1 Tax=unclassified Vibrio TaxID=2614977 RepID=UPI0029649E2A|nr:MULTISPECIES: hypothetical protein [unclassified Vibrio]MDW1948616.1 hypothetical protein [Vibrio sp. 812(2023)]MDW1976608.1 hypothetical protein [Vibrio sp. Vb1980]MDW1992044.1 hypothetical protein [Vibrio sp. 780]
MSEENLFSIDVNKLLSKLNTENLVTPTVTLLVIAVTAAITFFVILFHAIITKLDSNTEYSIHVSTQVVGYKPNDSSVPNATLPEFRLLKGYSDCPGLNKGKWYNQGELTFYKNSSVTLRLKTLNLIQINIEPEPESTRLAQLITRKGRCVIQEKFTVDIKLTKSSPDFIAILVGDVTLGKTLSYDTRSMPAFLANGEIEVKDSSFWFEDPISLPSISLSTGDTVLIPSDNKSAATGLLTVSFNEKEMKGVFNKKGGEVRIIKPFSSNEGSPISISFFERLYSDNALTIALSISFIVIQVVMFMITTLIRLTYIPRNTDDLQVQDATTIAEINSDKKVPNNETDD